MRHKRDMTRMFILGAGYSARRFLDLSPQTPGAVVATARSAQTAIALRALGIVPVRVDTEMAEDFAHAVRGADVLLASAQPGVQGDPFVEAVGRALVGAAVAPLMIYLSTIAVYGDHHGAWVDETTPATPASDRGRERVRAEQHWQALGQLHGAPVAVLRLPGIYGPGRSTFDQLRAGTARRIIKRGQVFNRIHVDDIASAIAAVMARRTGGIFNITDDAPAAPQDVVAYAATLLGSDPPPEVPFDSAAMTPMARSFYGECKRTSNARAKAVLGWQPRYPTYREGLAGILATGG